MRTKLRLLSERWAALNRTRISVNLKGTLWRFRPESLGETSRSFVNTIKC